MKRWMLCVLALAGAMVWLLSDVGRTYYANPDDFGV